MNWNEIAAVVSEGLNTEFKVTSAHAISGGDIHSAYQLNSNLGRYFVKTNHCSQNNLFATEAFSLQQIQESLSIKTPKVIHQGKSASSSWLILEFLDLSTQGDERQRGRDLALMHHHIQPHFGWAQDNYIGHSLQPNAREDNWESFYGQQRLTQQLKLAEKNGLSAKVLKQGEQLLDKLPQFFTHYQPKASLLHGDLWGGNSAFDADGEACFFDPASYYGDRETDIAMTKLFGGFSAEFYLGYNEVFPLDKGFKMRQPLYDLYHILNHYNLFGDPYTLQAEKLIRQLLKTKCD